MVKSNTKSTKKEMPESPSDSGKKEALKAALSQIEKAYGKGAIMTLGSQPIEKVPVISTGCISLNHALGIGGIPRGRVTEIYGPEAGGKTTLLLQTIAEAQKVGGTAAFIDAEHALDLTLARNTGVKIEDLLFSQPEYGEQGLEIVESLVRSGAFHIIGIDSVAALTPRSEIEGEMGDPSMGVQARLMSQALRKLTSVIAKSHTSVVFINQLRHKIGGYGNPETTPGGNALKFYASVRIDIRRIEALKKSGDTAIYGNRVRAKVVKNKLAPPFREAIFNIIFGKGVDTLTDIVDLAVEHNVIQKSGSWFSFGDDRIGQGTSVVRDWLSDNPDMQSMVTNLVLEKLS